jgi:F0F1-type ATP synthase epsilon subunit
MSEERDDQGKWVWAFLLGTIVGALLVVGVGGGLFMVQARRAGMAAEEAAMEAARAREMEMMAREEAERARQEAEHRLKEAEEARRKAEAEKAGKK